MRASLFSSRKLLNLIQKDLFILGVYLLLPYLFFASGINVFHTAIAPGDGIIQGVPTKIYTTQLQIWNPYIETGTSPFKDIGWQALYLPGIIVMSIFPNSFGYNLLLLLHYSLAGFFTFLFLNKLHLSRTASFIGGLTFMFCGFLCAHKGHDTMLMAASYLPIVFYFYERFFLSRKISFLFLTGITFGLSILADYTAVPMYIGMLLFPYIISSFLLEDRPFSSLENNGYFRSFIKKIYSIIICSAIIFGVGLLIASVQLLPIIESLKYITRESVTYNFFSSYSFPFSLSPLLIFPFLFGGNFASLQRYFGPWNLTELSGYMGILPLFFAVFSFLLFRKKNWRISFWTITAVLAGILVLGNSTPIYQIMYHVPVYNMFRVSARNWLEVNFAASILGAFFVHYLILSTQNEIRKYLKIAVPCLLIFCCGVFLIIRYARKFGQTATQRQLLLNNSTLSSPTIYIPLLIITLSILVIFLLFRFKQSRLVWSAVCLLIFFDLFSFGHFHDAFYPTFDILQNKPNYIDTYLKNEDGDKSLYRIFTLNMAYENQLYPLLNLLYGYNTVNGYGAIWLKDYAKLTNFATNGLTSFKHVLLSNSRILSLLSTKYIITSNQNDKDFLQSLTYNNSSNQEEILVDGFNNKSWILPLPFSQNSTSVLLKSKGGNQISLIEVPFNIEPNTRYQVSFKVRISKGFIKDDVPLVVYFYAKNYNNATSEAQLRPNEITDEYQEVTEIFYSGSSTPKSADLRFYTTSSSTYEIKEIKLIKTSNNILRWKTASMVVASSNLYVKKYESPEGVAVYENSNFLPRARFVPSILEVKDANQSIALLWDSSDLDPSQTALVEGHNGEDGLSGEVLQADYSKNDIVSLVVETGEKGFLVLSDNYYVGWKAFVDGKETKIYKTNGTSRGIMITGAGNHLVKFQFVPLSFYIGFTITILTLCVIIFLSIKIRKLFLHNAVEIRK